VLQGVLLSLVLAMSSLSAGPPIVRAVLLLLAVIVLMGGAVSRHE